jgi:large subunit ribosomal protein L3
METTPETQASSAPEATGSSAAIALTQGLGGILGVKAGMTQVFNENGDAIAVTVIDLRPNVVTQVKTKAKDGYCAVQVGFLDKKEKKATRAEKGHLKPVTGATGFYHYQEFRLPDNAKLDGIQVGQLLSPGFVKEGDMIDLMAVSKGRGFQGVMKRHNFSGGMASHGASVCHRSPGSIGNRADPAKVFKGKQMAGHMGHKRVTIQNVRVVKIDTENQYMLVHGSVPGPKSSVVTIRCAVKE